MVTTRKKRLKKQQQADLASYSYRVYLSDTQSAALASTSYCSLMAKPTNVPVKNPPRWPTTSVRGSPGKSGVFISSIMSV